MKSISLIFVSLLMLSGCSICTKESVNNKALVDATASTASMSGDVVGRSPISDEGPGGGGGREHPEGPSCYRDC
ncbi:hypothetical protein ACFL2V_10800 [Pseudomonadota bacterium]